MEFIKEEGKLFLSISRNELLDLADPQKTEFFKLFYDTHIGGKSLYSELGTLLKAIAQKYILTESQAQKIGINDTRLSE